METFVPVAQYLRMSTSNQRYSLDNQRAALARYAREHGMDIVQTYSDPGCSGLELKHRPGLRRLLQDVVAKPIFHAIIVYDVSRWGRFQDPDEAAHYEFLCKSAGVPVHYCSEMFVNDGTMANALLKQLKRTMAGEFSRELGVKVYSAQKRLIEMGHKMGGPAGYGLRRCIVQPDGTLQPLETGEHKALSVGWVTLVPGPASEVKVVREMFRLVAERGLLPEEIARWMNTLGLRNSIGKPWTHHTVTEILTNPKYRGVNAWGRTTQRLKAGVRSLPPDEWIAKEGAFAPVIDRALFDRVNRRLARRTEHRTNDDLLDDLRKLFRRKGCLSQRLVTLSDMTPAPSTYAHRFGSLLNAYHLIGYKLNHDGHSMIEQRNYRNRLRDELLVSLQTAMPNRIKIVRRDGYVKPMLIVDGLLPCAVLVWPALVTSDGHKRWLGRVRKPEVKYPMLICVLDRDNCRIERMYLSPPLGRESWATRTEHDDWFREHTRIQSVDQLCSGLLDISRLHSFPSSVFMPKKVGKRLEKTHLLEQAPAEVSGE